MFPFQSVPHYREAFLRLFYPARCGSCRQLLELEEKGICGGCHGDLKNLRLNYEQTSLDHPFKYAGQAWSCYPYLSPLKEILAGIKFYNKRWLLKVFSEDLREIAGLISSENSYDWIVPIPLENTRLLQRQFNQSEILAALLGKFMKCSVKGALKKSRATPAQSGLSRTQRLKNIHFAFECKGSALGKTILLVDDVLTTGATADEAARVLKESGALRVDLMTLACNPRETSDYESFSPLYTASNLVGY